MHKNKLTLCPLLGFSGVRGSEEVKSYHVLPSACW